MHWTDQDIVPTRGVASSKNVGWTHMTHGERAERKPIRGSGGRAPSGVQGQSPGGGETENLLAFGCPTEAANLPHSPNFAKSITPGICDTSDKELKVYRLRWHVRILCINKKQFGMIVVLVLCNVEL